MAVAAIGSALAQAGIGMIAPISETVTQALQTKITDFFSEGGDKEPPGYNSQDSVVRVRVGLDDGGAEKDLGGNVPLIVGSTTNDVFVGNSKKGGHITDGTFYDIAIPGKRQTPILDITAGGNDGICISDINMVWGDGSRFAFSGDWFRWCNMWWYHSNIDLFTSDGAPYQPPCGWLDGDASEGHKLAGFRVNMLALQNMTNNPDRSWNVNDTQSYCTNAFHFSGSKAAAYRSGNLDTTGDGSKGEKRHLDTRNSTTQPYSPGLRNSSHPRTLIVSAHENQSAQDLCDSDKSLGHDFVSTSEGKYCDMNTKRVYPLCSDTATRKCFSVDRKNRSIRRREVGNGHAVGFGERVHRNYHKVESWG